jgi:hypothetical protein
LLKVVLRNPSGGSVEFEDPGQETTGLVWLVGATGQEERNESQGLNHTTQESIETSQSHRIPNMYVTSGVNHPIAKAIAHSPKSRTCQDHQNPY